jgi:hypothetical protein
LLLLARKILRAQPFTALAACQPPVILTKSFKPLSAFGSELLSLIVVSWASYVVLLRCERFGARSAGLEALLTPVFAEVCLRGLPRASLEEGMYYQIRYCIFFLQLGM